MGNTVQQFENLYFEDLFAYLDLGPVNPETHPDGKIIQQIIEADTRQRFPNPYKIDRGSETFQIAKFFYSHPNYVGPEIQAEDFAEYVRLFRAGQLKDLPKSTPAPKPQSIPTPEPKPKPVVENKITFESDEECNDESVESEDGVVFDFDDIKSMPAVEVEEEIFDVEDEQSKAPFLIDEEIYDVEDEQSELIVQVEEEIFDVEDEQSEVVVEINEEPVEEEYTGPDYEDDRYIAMVPDSMIDEHEEIYVTYGHLQFPVQDLALATYLQGQLDADGDFEITADDFENSDDLPNAVTDVLWEAGYFKSESARKAATDLFDLYNDVYELNEASKVWVDSVEKYRGLFEGKTAVLPGVVWEKSVQAYLDRYPDLSRFGQGLSARIFMMNFGFFDLEIPDSNVFSQMNGCDKPYVRGFNASRETVPEIFRAAHQELHGNYFVTQVRMGKLNGDGYHYIKKFKCDDECPDGTSSLKVDRRLTWPNRRIDFDFYEDQSRVAFNTYRTGPCGTCFGQSAYVMTTVGPKTFFQIKKELKDTGAMPTLISYDEKTGETIEQVPDQFLDHAFREGIELLHLTVTTASADEMVYQVTAEHPMLVLRDGEQLWVEAGDLKTGDLLVSPDGQHQMVERKNGDVRFEGIATYNFSFNAPETGMIPTYLVSPDGVNWVVAHNKIK